MVLFVTRGWEFRGARLYSRVGYRSHGYKIETPTSGESSGPMMGHWWSILQKAACGCRAATINGCGKWQRLCQRISLQSSHSEPREYLGNSIDVSLLACGWTSEWGSKSGKETCGVPRDPARLTVICEGQENLRSAKWRVRRDN